MNTVVPIGPASVFLVSGGARGITAQCVIKMARTFQSRFILIGRTDISVPEPAWAKNGEDEPGLKKQMLAHYQSQGQKITPREIQRTCSRILAGREIAPTLSAIQQAGGRALYVSADITNGQTLKEQLAIPIHQMGPVTGLIHGAGNLADKRIENKTAEDFATVYTTKITGLENLFACINLTQLNHLVLFSSAAGFYGNIGQTDYALANDILNKIAHQVKRRYPSCMVFSFNWGPWDGGMVTPGLKQLFAQRGIPLIPIDTGAQILVNSLQAGGPVQTVVGGALALARTNLQQTTHRIRRKLTLAENPFLQDHIVGGVAVLPTVCAISWLGRTCEQCYPGLNFAQCRNFSVLKGIVFDQTLAAEYLVDLKETEQSHPDEMIIDASISSQHLPGKTRYHYRAQIVLKPELPDPPFYAFDPAVVTQDPSDISYYQDGTLFHGPGLQGVRNVLGLDSNKLTMVCKAPPLAASYQGQFQVHSFNPYAADVQFQSMVIWARHKYGAGSLPLACKFGEQFKTVPFNRIFYVSMEVESATASGMMASIVTHDEQGRIYNRISGAEVTISKQLNPLFRQNQARAVCQPDPNSTV